MFVFEEGDQKKLKVEAHFGKRKALAAIRTCCSHVLVGAPDLSASVMPQWCLYLLV
jgi:hypothetical protein